MTSRRDIGKAEPVNFEYVSANPTGPMHVGHGRGAVFGDALANLLSFAGFAVTREYYINDVGAQSPPPRKRGSTCSRAPPTCATASCRGNPACGVSGGAMFFGQRLSRCSGRP
jgi:hypothetical protein